MASVFPGALDSFATNRTDATVMATTHAADHNDANDAINEIEAKVGIGASTAVANSVLNSTSSGVSAWTATPTIAGLRSSTTTDKAYFDNQGVFATNFLTDARVMIKRVESGVRSSYVFGSSTHIQARQASSLGERLIGYQAYMEDSSATEKTVTGAVDNGSGLVRLTVTGHGYATGNKIVVWDVGGVTAANGLWTITSIDADTIDLQASTFSGIYTSGGKASNRAPYYAFQAMLVPSVARTGLSGSVLNYDDVVGLGIYNAGTGKATDGVYIDGNPALSGSKFICLFSGNTDADTGLFLAGTFANDCIDIDGATVTNGDGITIGSNTVRFSERSDPSAPAANSVRLYAKDDGSGNTQLAARFATGAVHALSTQGGTPYVGTTLTLGTNAADAGTIRVPNNNWLISRNQANSGNVNLISANTSNEIQLGNGNVIRIPTLTKITTGAHIELGTAGTGTQWGTGTTQKQAWWGATPTTQPTNVTNPTGGTTIDAEARTAIDAILSRLETIGLFAA